jgi:hypothetical protein
MFRKLMTIALFWICALSLCGWVSHQEIAGALTTGNGSQYTLKLSEKLSDSTAHTGTQTYYMIEGALTATATTGWDTVGLLRLKAGTLGTTTILTLSSTGAMALTGSLNVSTTLTAANVVATSAINAPAVNLSGDLHADGGFFSDPISGPAATFTGNVGAGGYRGTASTDLGAVVKAGANAACTTTCGTTGGCLFGLDDADGGQLRTCADGRSDTCLCLPAP